MMVSFNVLSTDLDTYNKAKNDAESFIGNTGNSTDSYSLYMSTLARCGAISGTVFNAGDSRFPRGACLKMLGVYDAYHGTSSSLSGCDDPNIPPDISIPSSVSVINPDCGNMTVRSCPERTFTVKVASTNAVVTFPDGYYAGTKAAKKSSQNGQVCGDDAHIECAIQARCDGSTYTWEKEREVCNCVSNTITEGKTSCSEDQPADKPYCRCGNWVNWNTFSQTYDCD